MKSVFAGRTESVDTMLFIHLKNRGGDLHKVCIIDNQVEYPIFRIRKYFNSFNIDCFISNNSSDGNIDIQLFVCDKDEGLARALLEIVDFIVAKDSCPRCCSSKYISGNRIFNILFNLKKEQNNFCWYCKFKW